MKKAGPNQTKESKVYHIGASTLYYQKLGAHKKFVGVHLYTVCAICRTMAVSWCINRFVLFSDDELPDQGETS